MPNSSLYPLKFQPCYLTKIWGGRKLEAELGRRIPPGEMIGESWEIFDFPPGVVEASDRWVSSVVGEGPLQGRTLHELVMEFGPDLSGDVPLLGEAGQGGQFPILIKYLDARQDLSVQVHPDRAFVAAHPDAHWKSEAWYILQADPGSRILKGLRGGMTREKFAQAIADGSVEQAMRSIPAKAGHCHYLPSGTVHALGAGILVAEVQTPSDTTFRIFDFNRVDPSTGKTRALQVERALECIDFDSAPQPPQTRSHVAGYFTTVTRLVRCPYFQIEKVRFTEGIEEPVPYDEPVIWMMLEGEAEIRVQGIDSPTRFKRGDTVLLPAVMKNPIIKTLKDCAWLEVTIPTKSAAE